MIRLGLHAGIALALGASAFSASTIAAQTTTARPGVVTAAEAARNLEIYPLIGVIGNNGVRVDPAHLDSVINEMTRAGIKSLENVPVNGIQSVPMSRLYAKTKQDAMAERQLDSRIATPWLSIGDKAYALLAGTLLFSTDLADTTRMRVARKYMTQLDALPEGAITLRFHAHAALASRYYRVGDGKRVREHMETVLHLVQQMPFERRNWSAIGGAFLVLANVLSGEPNGRTAIDSIGKWLLPYTQSPIVGIDSQYHWASVNNRRDFEKVLQMTAFLGQKIPDVQAHYWWNTPVPKERSQDDSLASRRNFGDGKIRLSEFGTFGCGACKAALPKLEQIRQRAPSNVEVWYVTSGGDVWGATRETNAAGAEHLRKYYIDQKRFGLPIALWIGQREPDADGGTLQKQNPVWDAIGIRSIPVFVVTDGRGIVRHISIGFSEPVLTSAVNYLVAEASRATTRASLQ
jgi:thiol-disulfide isomerase/thioredoxin